MVPRVLVSATDLSNNDALIIQNQSYAEFGVGGATLDQQGPVYQFPQAKGSQASGAALDGLAAATERGIVSNGVPAPGAVGLYAIPIYVSPDDTFKGLIRFFAAQTLTQPTEVEMALCGWIKRPLS